MMSNRQMWRSWAEQLCQWGVSDWVASFLEVAGPLSWVGAQAIYVGQPVLRLAFSDGFLSTLANMLEDPLQARAFAGFLRESETP